MTLTPQLVMEWSGAITVVFFAIFMCVGITLTLIALGRLVLEKDQVGDDKHDKGKSARRCHWYRCYYTS